MLNLPHSLLKRFNQLVFLLLLFHPVHAGDNKLGDHPAFGAGPAGARQTTDALVPPQTETHHTSTKAVRIPLEGKGILSPPLTLAQHFVCICWEFCPIQGTRVCVCFWTSAKAAGISSMYRNKLFCECSRKPKTQIMVSQTFETEGVDSHFNEIWSKSYFPPSACS